MLPQLDRPVDLAVEGEVLAPVDFALNDDTPFHPGDAVGGRRSAGTLPAWRRRTTDRSSFANCVWTIVK